MQVFIDNSYGKVDDLPNLEGLALYALEQEGAPEAAELSVSLVDTGRIWELNRQYRGVDAPTDVLSFECEREAEDGLSEVVLLGDVIIAIDVAREDALTYRSSFSDEMELLLVHGILHLLGYDHVHDDEADAMEAREDALLKGWRAHEA
ncbi:MAG: rRNA maturation RNase YbeY [Coriobacteriales bacterium]|jgi:probable rRNA maturation factor|nr:rRNA maturation RNase YbeY [Coriobacteriales bacterium]